MGTKLAFCLFFATHLYAESIEGSSNATSISTSTNATLNGNIFDDDEDLAKIASSCMTTQEYEELAGNYFRIWYARIFSGGAIQNAQEIIGLTELRAVLGFAPPGHWIGCNFAGPSTEELAAASTTEQYFDLMEPCNFERSLGSRFFFEKNFPPVIAFLDKRFPSIRQYFRRRFEEILRLDAGETIDRKTVDRMIDEFTNTLLPNVDRATRKMYRNYKCEGDQ